MSAQRAALLSATSLVLSLVAGTPAPAATLGGTANVYLSLDNGGCMINMPEGMRSSPADEGFIGAIGTLVASCGSGVGAFEVSSDDARHGYVVDIRGSPVVVQLVPVFQVGEGRPLADAFRYPGPPDTRLITFSF